AGRHGHTQQDHERALQRFPPGPGRPGDGLVFHGHFLVASRSRMVVISSHCTELTVGWTRATMHAALQRGVSPMRETWTFHTAGQLLFGRTAVRQLGEIAGRLGARRVLLVTDQILVRAGVAARVQAPLAESGVTVETFDGGEPEPSLRAAEGCTAVAR